MFQNTLIKAQPKIQDIENFKLSKHIPWDQLMLLYGWETAKEVFSSFLQTIAKEYEFSNMNDCQAVLYVLSSEENNLVESANSVEKINSDKLKKTLGGELNENTIRIVIVIHDQTKNKDMELQYIDEHKMSDFKNQKKYSSKLIGTGIEGKTPNRTENPWLKEFNSSKKYIKSYDSGVE